MGCDGLHRNPATMEKICCETATCKKCGNEGTFYNINVVFDVFK